MGKNNKPEYNATVADDNDGMIGDELVPEDKIPKGSISRRFHKKWLHLLRRGIDGVLYLPEITQAGPDTITPSDLYDALEDNTSHKIFCEQERPAKHVAIGVLIAIVIVIIIVGFFMWVIQSGKNPVQPAALLGLVQYVI